MPIVGIPGCGWVRGNTYGGWDTGMTHSELRVVVLSRACTRTRPKTSQPQHNLTSSHKDSWWSYGGSTSMLMDLKTTIKKENKQEGGKQGRSKPKRPQTKTKAGLVNIHDIDTSNPPTNRE